MSRRTRLVLGLLGAGLGLLTLEVAHAAIAGRRDQARLAETARLVARAGLTDLALFTEARYTRHPAMADLHTAFQDNPMGFEHFPSGTFAPRPAGGWGTGTLRLGAGEVPK